VSNAAIPHPAISRSVSNRLRAKVNRHRAAHILSEGGHEVTSSVLERALPPKIDPVLMEDGIAGRYLLRLLESLERAASPRGPGPRRFPDGRQLDAEMRQRQSRALLAPSGDPRADMRDPRWTSQRAVGSHAFVARYTPRRRGRPRNGTVPSQNDEVRPQVVSGAYFSVPLLLVLPVERRPA
jgi:hypothetical protein